MSTCGYSCDSSHFSINLSASEFICRRQVQEQFQEQHDDLLQEQRSVLLQEQLHEQRSGLLQQQLQEQRSGLLQEQLQEQLLYGIHGVSIYHLNVEL